LGVYILVRIVRLASEAAGMVFFVGSLFSALSDSGIGALLARFPKAERMLPGVIGFALPLSAASFAIIPALLASAGFASAAMSGSRRP
jgi:hypothetical protein